MVRLLALRQADLEPIRTQQERQDKTKMEFSGYSYIQPACLWDEEGTNYEDLEGNDYPVNPFDLYSTDDNENDWVNARRI